MLGMRWSSWPLALSFITHFQLDSQKQDGITLLPLRTSHACLLQPYSWWYYISMTTSNLMLHLPQDRLPYLLPISSNGHNKATSYMYVCHTKARHSSGAVWKGTYAMVDGSWEIWDEVESLWYKLSRLGWQADLRKDVDWYILTAHHPDLQCCTLT